LNSAEAVKTFLGCQPNEIAEKVLISPVLKPSAVRGKVNEIRLDFGRKYGWSGFTASYHGEAVTFINSGQGPSRVGDLMLTLAGTACRKVLFIGSLGALLDDVEIGDLVLVESAQNGEGFSRYWTKDFKLADLLEQEKINGSTGSLACAEEVLNQKKHKYHKGNVLSIGSVLAESSERLQELKSAGYVGIEQECSALYTAARYTGISAHALCYVLDLPLEKSLTDELSAEDWQKQKRALDLLPELGLEILRKMQDA
jgi:purine-nucleoside phosphorylase